MHPALLQQRLPGRPAIELLGTPKLRTVVRALGSLQAGLHGIDPSDFELPCVDAAGFLSGDLTRRRQAVNAVDQTGTWEWLHDTVERTLTSSRREAAVLCHGDFYPLNALRLRRLGYRSRRLDRCEHQRSAPRRRPDRSRSSGSHADRRASARALGSSAAPQPARPDRIAQCTNRCSVPTRRLPVYLVADRALVGGWLQLNELAEGAVPSRDSSTTSRLPDDLTDRLLQRCRRFARTHSPEQHHLPVTRPPRPIPPVTRRSSQGSGAPAAYPGAGWALTHTSSTDTPRACAASASMSALSPVRTVPPGSASATARASTADPARARRLSSAARRATTAVTSGCTMHVFRNRFVLASRAGSPGRIRPGPSSGQ